VTIQIGYKKTRAIPLALVKRRCNGNLKRKGQKMQVEAVFRGSGSRKANFFSDFLKKTLLKIIIFFTIIDELFLD
jgi:hypothetical protein